MTGQRALELVDVDVNVSQPRLPLARVGARRRRRAASEGEVDERWLRWIGQHRFVGIDGLTERFAVSRVAAWRRLRRLEDSRLIVRRRAAGTTIVHLSDRATRLLELPRRKPPRAPLASLQHDLAVARWHGALERACETAGNGAVVLSERGLRERHTPRRSYCAYVADGKGGRVLQRWADVAIEHQPGGPLHAWELEFSEKTRGRLQAIIRGYAGDPRFARVTYLVTRPALARRLAQLIVAEQAHELIDVQPWHDLDQDTAQEVRRRVAAVFATLPSTAHTRTR